MVDVLFQEYHLMQKSPHFFPSPYIHDYASPPVPLFSGPWPLDWTFLDAHFLTLGHTHALCKALFIGRICPRHSILRPFPNESIFLLSIFFFCPDAQPTQFRNFSSLSFVNKGSLKCELRMEIRQQSWMVWLFQLCSCTLLVSLGPAHVQSRFNTSTFW